MKNIVSKKIKELRLEHGLSQMEMSEILKIDQSNYSKYERGIFEPNTEMILIIAKHFGVTTDFLFGLED